MALTKFNQQPEQNDNILMCGVHNCTNRWTVHMEGQRPMCSFHQWGGKNPQSKVVQSKQAKSISEWYDDKDEVY